MLVGTQPVTLDLLQQFKPQKGRVCQLTRGALAWRAVGCGPGAGVAGKLKNNLLMVSGVLPVPGEMSAQAGEVSSL